MFEQEGYTQTADTSPFETGVGAGVGGEIHVDGTPMRLATIVIGGILLLIVLNQMGIRYHVLV